MSRRNNRRQHAYRVSKTPLGKAVMENMRHLGEPEKQLLPGLAKILAGCPDEDDDILYMDSDMLADNDIAIQFEKVKKSRGLAKAQAESELDRLLRDQERRDFPA